MNQSRALYIFTIFSILSSPPLLMQAAEMYRWVDRDGVVHYTDVAPEDAKDTKKLNIHDPEHRTETRRESIAPEKRTALRPQAQSAADSLHRIKSFPISKQDGPWCALATIEMIAHYYGYGISQIQVSLESDISRDKGMSLDAFLEYFDRLGILMLNVEHRYSGTLDDVKELINRQIPVIWLHRARIGPRWAGLHSAVVTGYDDEKRFILVADPACGCEIAVPYQEFLMRWQQTNYLYVVVTSRL
jgi:hypothetical protein